MNEGKIYQKLLEIQKEVTFIAKDRSTSSSGTFKGYKYRGIDDVAESFNPLFKKYNVAISIQPNQPNDKFDISHDGNTIEIFATVHIRLLCLEDGSYIDGISYGSAKDNGGTIAGKVLSYAIKYFLFDFFLIPTDDPNADSETFQPEPKQSAIEKKAHSQAWTDNMTVIQGLLKDRRVSTEVVKQLQLDAFGKSSPADLTDDEIMGLRTKLEETYGE